MELYQEPYQIWWSIRNQLRVRRTPHIIVFKGLFDIVQRDILDAERTVARVQDHREISVVEIDGIDENVDQACIQAAAVITATIISITSIGGVVGCKPKTKVKIPRPIPPITPKPIPPKRAPTMIAVKTKANCSIIPFFYTLTNCTQMIQKCFIYMETNLFPL